MKQILSCTLAAVILIACNNDKKVKYTEKNADGTTTTTSVDASSVKDNTDEMNKKIEELKKLPPLTLDQLKALLPDEVNGIKRTNFSANSSMGFSLAEGEYQKDDTTDIKIAIYDCAGESGSSIYSLNYWTKMNIQQESSNGYTKTIDFNGGKAVESFEKNNNESTLTYVANDRLLVVLTGRNVSADDLKSAAKNLNLKV
jgi:hypothetical protein